jgi:hypothetical protein
MLQPSGSDKLWHTLHSLHLRGARGRSSIGVEGSWLKRRRMF